MPDQPGPDTESIRASVGGQAVSLALFVAALLPPIVLALLRGLSGASNTIATAALWSWGAVALAAVVTLRGALGFLRAGRATALGPLIGSAVLLLIPAIVVLALRLNALTVSMPLAIAQIVLYCAAGIMLLLGRFETGGSTR